MQLSSITRARVAVRALRLLSAERRWLGGPGSGNFGHSGRPGEVGGSGEGGAAPTPLTHPDVVLGEPSGVPGYKAYIAKHGEHFQAAPLPADVERGQPKECYKNASLLVLQREDLDYAEGFATTTRLPGLVFMHAWAVDQSGKVVDPTWDRPEGGQYFGVKYDRKTYLAHLFKAKMYGVIAGDRKIAREAIDTDGKRMRGLGGPGSGNFGHAGRPGEVGGSAEGSAGGDEKSRQALEDALVKSAAVIANFKIKKDDFQDESLRGGVKASIVENLSKTLLARPELDDPEQYEATVDDVLTDVQYRLDLWAETSGDSDPRSSDMQRAIAKEFDLKDVETDHLSDKTYHQSIGDWSGSAGVMDENKDRLYSRIEYDTTQKWFADQGITEVTLYRGHQFENLNRLGKETLTEGVKSVSMQPASSWTTDAQTAVNFASGNGGRTKGAVFVTKVPVSRILSTCVTGRGCLSEFEVVLLGGKTNVRQYTYEGKGVSKLVSRLKKFKAAGGPGSGNFDHAGRPGEVGGSAPGTGASNGDSYGTSDLSEASKAEADRVEQSFMDQAIDVARFESGRLALIDEPYAQHESESLLEDIARLKNIDELGYVSEHLRGNVKQDIVSKYPAELGAQDKINLWAETSGDHDARAATMQRAVQEEFGLKDASTGHLTEAFGVSKEAQGSVEKTVELDRKYSREEYEKTQKFFQDKGITHVTVFRGHYYDPLKPRPAEGVQDITLQPASSWSTRTSVAHAFAGDSDHAGVFVARVPVSRVLSTCVTGRGCLPESEVILLGGKMTVHLVHPGYGGYIGSLDKYEKVFKK